MVNASFEPISSAQRVWPVGALCRAIADALEARFNPVSVSGEISGFTRATSGHCYFVLKDAAGQLRCAMFRRAASQLDFSPKDGELVELRGRLGVYEPRGELQLVVESMSRAGKGTLFEQFFQIKARLQEEGLFDAERKRALSVMPRAIGIVTSLGASALHDVVTALQRRAPHLPVVLSPAAVQGENAPRELIQALERLYQVVTTAGPGHMPIDAILLVRGGGSLEDLWAFNDEALARALARSPVPIVSGVGHETDFTIADFVADVRAPTPTAAAELVSPTAQAFLQNLVDWQQRLRTALQRSADRESQNIDRLATRVGRPSGLVQRERVRLAQCAHMLAHAASAGLRIERMALQRHGEAVSRGVASATAAPQNRLSMLAVRLESVDPQLVLQRGYAWLADAQGLPLTSAAHVQTGQSVVATLADGVVDMEVTKTTMH